MHSSFHRTYLVVIVRVRQEPIGHRMAAALVKRSDEPAGPKATFLRLRADEARKAARYPGRTRR